MLNVRIATPPWDRATNNWMEVNPGVASSYIFSKNADIVFLQDIRLGDKLGTFLKKIKCTKYGNFTAYTNSDKDSRGVAILFNNSLDFSVLSEFRDPDQNLLILDVSIKKHQMLTSLCLRP